MKKRRLNFLADLIPHERTVFKMEETMEETIREIIAKQLRIDADDIDEFSDIMDDLNADSLDVVEILMEIEDNFGVNIPDEDLVEIRTFRDVCDYVEHNM